MRRSSGSSSRKGRQRDSETQNLRWKTPSWKTRSRETPGPALVELKDSWCGEPMWLLGAVIPGYRTAVRIGERGAMSVAYLGHGSGSPDEVIARANALAAEGSLGAHGNDPLQQEVLERAFEERNPTLAILAS